MQDPGADPPSTCLAPVAGVTRGPVCTRVGGPHPLRLASAALAPDHHPGSPGHAAGTLTLEVVLIDHDFFISLQVDRCREKG